MLFLNPLRKVLGLKWSSCDAGIGFLNAHSKSSSAQQNDSDKSVGEFE